MPTDHRLIFALLGGQRWTRSLVLLFFFSIFGRTSTCLCLCKTKIDDAAKIPCLVHNKRTFEMNYNGNTQNIVCFSVCLYRTTLFFKTRKLLICAHTPYTNCCKSDRSTHIYIWISLEMLAHARQKHQHYSLISSFFLILFTYDHCHWKIVRIVQSTMNHTKCVKFVYVFGKSPIYFVVRLVYCSIVDVVGRITETR